MNGLEAVKAQITSQFNITEKDIEEHLDFDTKDVILRFGAGDREHDVRVSREFNDDYADSKLRADFSHLKELLHTHGAVYISRRGIALDERSVNAHAV
jgi:hypothetical protein